MTADNIRTILNQYSIDPIDIENIIRDIERGLNG